MFGLSIILCSEINTIFIALMLSRRLTYSVDWPWGKIGMRERD